MYSSDRAVNGEILARFTNLMNPGPPTGPARG
jgi:hypothetical protein